MRGADYNGQHPALFLSIELCSADKAQAQLLQLIGLVDDDGLETLIFQGRNHLAAMLHTLGFHVDGNRHIAHGERTTHTGVIHTGHVRVVLRNNAGNGRQLTRTVRQHHLHGHVAASRRQTTLNHLQH